MLQRLSIMAISLALFSASSTLRAADLEVFEKRALNARRAIKSGHVVTQSQWWKITASGTKNLALTLKTESWFDGNNIRTDTRRPVDPKDVEEPTVRELLCTYGNTHAHWQGDRTDGKPGTKIKILRKEMIDPKLISQHFDPRKLGYLPVSSDNTIYFGLDGFIGRADKINPAIVSVLLDNINCDRATYKLDRGGATVRVWYAPSLGDNVVRIELEYNIPEELLLERVSTKYTQHENGLWFPNKCTYERFIKGELAEVEEAACKIIQLNKPIEDTSFRVPGFGLPNGTVVNIGSGKELVWENADLKPRPASGKMGNDGVIKPYPIHNDDSDRVQTSYTLGGILLGATCVLGVTILLISKRKQKLQH